MGKLTFSKPRVLTEEDSVEGFSCGVELIDNWVAKHARSAKRLGTAVVYVVYDSDGKLAALYSLSSQSMLREDASGWIARNTPGQIPVILMGMFGINEKYQGLGLGHQLMIDAVHRCAGIAEQLGAKALVVDPIDDKACNFYKHFGFREIPGTSRMYAKLAK